MTNQANQCVPYDHRPTALGDLMQSGWFNIHRVVGMTVTLEHFIDPARRHFGAPIRRITGRVLAVTQSPDGDVALRLDGLPVYTLSPSDVIRIQWFEHQPAPQLGLGRAY